MGIQSKSGPRGLKARSYRGWLGCVRSGLRGELELGGAQERGKKKEKKREENFEREEGRKREGREREEEEERRWVFLVKGKGNEVMAETERVVKPDYRQRTELIY